ncbi:MAG: hypothetical protein K0Q71_5061 [Thermomicrobiales bacterium]|nr:hypothetical protein [Thermomicrobiales bacterium]
MMTDSAMRRTVSRDGVDSGDAPSTKGDLFAFPLPGGWSVLTSRDGV